MCGKHDCRDQCNRCGYQDIDTAFMAFSVLSDLLTWAGKDGALQYFEEHRKGSLEVGKLADMVVLYANPFYVDPMTLTNIDVLETIKEGATIYAAEN